MGLGIKEDKTTGSKLVAFVKAQPWRGADQDTTEWLCVQERLKGGLRPDDEEK
jgi:hypothetical protein